MDIDHQEGELVSSLERALAIGLRSPGVRDLTISHVQFTGVIFVRPLV